MTNRTSSRRDNVRANTRSRRGGKLGFGCARMLHRLMPARFGAPFHFQIVLLGPDGQVKGRLRQWNTVTTNGREGIADNLLASPTLGKPTHMAVGTGSPAANALGAENTRVALTSKTRSGAVVTMIGDYAAGVATAALTEAGVFNQSSGGNMWLSTSYSVINKGANDTLQITWTLTIS